MSPVMRRQPSSTAAKCYANKIGYVIAERDGILSFCRDDVVKTDPRPAVFLDRDGVLNRRIVGGYVASWNDFEILPGVLSALRSLSALDILLIIVSNQAGVAKRILSSQDLAEITCRSLKTFAAAGGIDAAFFCLHQPSDACSCRKPQVGLLQSAADRFKIDFRRSFLVGDSPADIEAGRRMGCRTVYVARSVDDSVKASFQARTLGQAARLISSQLQI